MATFQGSVAKKKWGHLSWDLKDKEFPLEEELRKVKLYGAACPLLCPFYERVQHARFPEQMEAEGARL